MDQEAQGSKSRRSLAEIHLAQLLGVITDFVLSIIWYRCPAVDRRGLVYDRGRAQSSPAAYRPVSSSTHSSSRHRMIVLSLSSPPVAIILLNGCTASAMTVSADYSPRRQVSLGLQQLELVMVYDFDSPVCPSSRCKSSLLCPSHMHTSLVSLPDKIHASGIRSWSSVCLFSDSASMPAVGSMTRAGLLYLTLVCPV